MAQIADAQAKQADTGEYEAPCPKGEYNYKSDLCAQWYAARAARDAAGWAYWSVFWSIVSIGLSGIGLVALLITIRQGRQANKIARIAMKEARLSNQRSFRLAKETSETQLRPYVYFVESDEVMDGMFSRDDYVGLAIKNFGQTPAPNVVVRFGRHMCKRPIGNTKPGFDIGEDIFPVIPNGHTQQIKIHLRMFTREDIAKVASGEWVFLIRVQCQYPIGNGEFDTDDTISVFDRDALKEGGRFLSKEERERTE